jgi:CheY-like chemotaxis protein
VLAHAFELFFQADRTLDRAQGGLGIGLALVRQLVQLHGGSVEGVSAGRERGSRFTVRFPRAEPAGIRKAAETGPGSHLGASRIVIVEDNRDAREMLRVLLALAGHEVYEAEDGPGAVEMIRATEPDIAFVDVGLPGCDGYEVARRVRAIPRICDVFLVALTGYAQPEDKTAALEAGFDMHVVKPVDQNHLRSVIAAAQSRRSRSAESAK